jgi:hypothetical protein
MRITSVGPAVLFCSLTGMVGSAQVLPEALGPRNLKQCLSDAQLDAIRKGRDLDRPSNSMDAEARTIFNPDYFIGRWTFEWNVPDFGLASAGLVTGTYTIKRLEGCFYDGTMEVEGPDGKYTGTVLLAYDPRKSYLTWYESDSRGFSLLKVGPVGGDPGGYFTYSWETPPVTVKGHTFRFAGTTLMSARGSFRYRPSISLDGIEWVSYGNPWFTKVEGDGAVPASRRRR